ncbi:N-acyl-D-amino-acid deacylase [Brevibacillus sp. AG162]|uniref:N-acyl-D-amino-acid deacylase family protein n=1 Tax=Brevibacillus sp. AG162 TaxID=2572910 RepID=UPI001154F348|nr:D-aminoacylase [Brevibacillus sp. AG162]TQK73935.1 N-acyl-D-amino-acid deacylase [Brevibacillus sp. AG162]
MIPKKFDIVIRNGMVCDGTGNPWTGLDIGIENGLISHIAKSIPTEGSKEIDATGMVVTPGFIDAHVHSDLWCTRPDIHQIRVLQGITTELVGQDGVSVAPVTEETKPLWMKQLKRINGDIGEWPWNSIEEYLAFLEKAKLNGNAAYLVPHGNIRSIVMGFDGREATQKEVQAMQELVELGMQQGAFGVSSGIQYPPCVYANKEELVGICKGAAKYDGCFVVHIRNESNYSLEALDEVIDAARRSGVRLHVSHFKICGGRNRDKLDIALEKLEQGRAEGIEITFDQYPYAAASTFLHAILPPWMHDGGIRRMLERLHDPKLRERAKEEIMDNGEYDNPVRNNGWDNLVIASVASVNNRGLEGMSLQEIAQRKGIDPAYAAFDLLIEEEGEVTIIIHWGNEYDVERVMKHSLQMVGSDGVFGGKPHPRLYGSFARVLGHYAREKQSFPLWEAVRKMTGAPAQLLRLRDRGFLREGYWADIVVFDPNVIVDRATYENPLQHPVGIRHVLVNGKIAVSNGRLTNAVSGSVIRYQS